jgi:hypothetical protein
MALRSKGTVEYRRSVAVRICRESPLKLRRAMVESKHSGKRVPFFRPPLLAKPGVYI